MSRPTVRKKSVRRTQHRQKSTRLPLPRPPRTLRQFRAMSPEHQELWIQTVNTVTKARREHLTLTRAARAIGVDANAVRKLAGTAFRKDTRGRLVPTKRDRLLRVLMIPGPKGTRQVAVRNSLTSSQLGGYADAAGRYVRRGDPSALAPFRRLALKDANGRRIHLVMNLKTLNELGQAGVLSFESLYARSAS